MYFRLALRFLKETDKRLLWKAAWTLGVRGLWSIHRHKRRLKKGEFFPPFLYLSVINSCNLRCQGCWVDVGAKQHRIEVEAGRCEPQRCWEFPRLLTQVRLSPGGNRNSPNRLLLTRHGHGCELGRCLTDEERAEVAERLKSWVTATELP